MTATPTLRVLVTGATGYVGSRLVPELLTAGHTVLAATRDPQTLEDYPWAGEVESREFDIEDDSLIREAVTGCDAVVYLVHSMESEDFVEKDRAAAERMASACEQAGVGRIVYLSGLVPDGELSDHLQSRLEVEQIFLDSQVPTVVLRAAMIIGAGSTSFELLRRISDRVPRVTPVPRWMNRRLQPVAVDDVVHLLRRALEGPDRNRHYDVGADDIVTYPELLAAYATAAGLQRRQILVRGLSVAVVGRGCARITGMPVSTVASLVESLEHDMVCSEDAVRRDLLEPGYRFTPLAEALTRALQPETRPGTAADVDALTGAPTDP
ncbi:hypothetical protein GCM10027020_24950 [Nocardioides salsibiostraticola]